MNSIVPYSKLTSHKQRRSVSFSKVEVYYFDRAQGFICVPSQGGSTLGMQAVHWASEEFSVNSHQHLRLLERYAFILRKCKNGKLLLAPDQVSYLERTIRAAPEPILNRIFGCWPRHGISFFDSVMLCPQSHNEEKLGDSTGSEASSSPMGSTETFLTGLPIVRHPHPRETVVSIEDEDERLTGILDCYFLPLLSIKKRRMLLRRAGLKTVDPAERAECQAIRLSRDVCGCDCPDGVCLPTQCHCALNGIKCQVDRVSFPCPCTSPTRCQNPEGRIEFNPIRVRTHYLHTRMRLDVERRDRASASAAELRNAHDDDAQRVAKRARLDDLCPSQAEHCHTDDQSAALHVQDEVPDADRDQSAFSRSKDDSNQPLFNTTVNGGCRDCEDDHYVHLLLMQEFASRSEVPEFPTATVTDPAGASSEFDAPLVMVGGAADLPLPQQAVPLSVDHEAGHLTEPRITSPTEPRITSPTEPVLHEQLNNLHEQALSIYSVETETMNSAQQVADSVICSVQTLIEPVTVYTQSHGSIHPSFDPAPLSTHSFEPDSGAAIPVPAAEELTSFDPPPSVLTYPFTTPEESCLFTMNNCDQVDTENHSNTLGKCTLEPISALFASCSSVTAQDGARTEHTVLPAISEEIATTSAEAQRMEQPHDLSSTDLLTPACTALDSLPTDATNAASPVPVGVNCTATPLYDARNKCSEPDNSPRNSTPPSSPYLESVRA